MNTYIAYFDETGDDGANTQSSKQFVLTSAYMDSNSWQSNYRKIYEFRKELRKSMDYILLKKYTQSIW